MTRLYRFPFLLNLFSIIGVLPPLSFSQKQLPMSWRFKLKACVLIATFTVSSLTTVVVRNLIVNNHPVVYRVIDTCTCVSFLLLIVFNLYYPWIHQLLYEQVFFSLFQLNFKTQIPDLTLRRYFLRMSVTLAVLLWYHTPPKWSFNTRYFIGVFGYFNEEVIFPFYFLNISFIHEALLCKCKMQFQTLNHRISSFRQSTIYDATHIHKKIKNFEYTFIKLTQTTQTLNQILSPTIFILPMFCCSYLLQFCIYMKHISYDYSTSVNYTLAASAFISMFVVNL